MGRGQKLNVEKEEKGAASIRYFRKIRKATPATAALLVGRVNFMSSDLNN
jgi:hypothetical protein